MKILKPIRIPLSLYIHLPWCEKRCPYCDFNIEINKQDGDEEALIRAILKDVDNSKDYINNRKFISIYFGGGTPSLVSVKFIRHLIDKLKNDLLIHRDCEINFELNPNEVNEKYINGLIAAGINRISIGIQSFDQVTLASLERNHHESDSLKAIKIISAIDSINTTIDLIYGVMGQTLDSLKKDIEIFCNYSIDHLSLYQLTIEPNTIFYKKKLLLPRDKLIADMEKAATNILNANQFYQYEVSSWSKKNKYSNHNLNYWMYGDYLGVGPGAHSKITMNESIKRMIKLKAVQSYIDAPSKTKDFFINSESYDLDLAMNLLRIKQGISFKEIEEKGIYIPDTFMEKRLEGIEKGLLDKEGIKASSIGYKFLNDTINLFS